jgi:hypothetical protein
VAAGSGGVVRKSVLGELRLAFLGNWGMSAIFDKTDLKVAIVGAAPATRAQVPWDDESWEIWGLSDQYPWMKRWDRWFELHNLQRYREKDPSYVEWLGKQTKPLCVQEVTDELPNATRFPIEDFTKRFGSYVTNSISYMIGFALMQGAKQIALYGVEMAYGSEYAYQRPNVELFIGLARGAGVNVWVPDESPLMKCGGMYGYESEPGKVQNLLEAKRKELLEKKSAYLKQQETAAQSLFVLDGCLQMLDWVKQWQ